MPKFIGLQAGHQNITSNPDPTLASETGAPGEEPFNVAVRDILGTLLIQYGFQVQLDDANANVNPNTTDKDFDFYLAIHAESEPQGGAIAAPDPSVDQNNTESKRIVDAIQNEYFQDTGIVRNDQIINNNMTFYYMWQALSAKTPCGIIECGALADAHDSVILNDHRRVALGIAHGICQAFGVEWKGDPDEQPAPTPPAPEPPAPPEPTPPAPEPTCDEKLAALQKEFDDYKASHPDQPSTPAPEVPPTPSTSETPPAQPNLNFWLELSDLIQKHFGKK
jgi:hypothetical protein